MLLTSAVAFKRILDSDVQSHREWVVRSYALIFAAVTLRIYMPIFEVTRGEFTGYARVAWLCWVPNILLAEWMIHTSMRARREPRRSALIA